MNKVNQGDLVVVVRGHCTDKFVGLVFRVDEVGIGKGVCTVCRKVVGTGVPYVGSLVDGYFPKSNVKRIPPLDELESQKHDDEILA